MSARSTPPRPAGPPVPLRTWLAHGGKLTTAKPVVITMMAFAVMNFTTVVSMRGLPAQAEYGLASIFYYVFAAVVFLIPTSLVAAELASTFPKQGGMFRWVGEAFGIRWGFAAVYWQWQAWVLWFPTVLIFVAAALAYMWWPLSFDQALAGSKLYTIITLLAVYWGVTIYTFRGMRDSARLSTYGGLFGTIIPASILVVLAGIYILMGHPVKMPLNSGFIPDFSTPGNMVLAAGIFLYYAGIETQAVHVKNLKNPARDYPLSILIATAMTVAVFVLGTLAVGVVVAQKDININESLLMAYRTLWAVVGLPWLGNVMAFMLAIGVVGQVSVVVAGPSTGLLAVGKAGHLPLTLQKTNAHGMPVAILVLQGIIVTILCLAFTVLPSVQSAYQIISQISNIMFLVYYIMMYTAAIRLRYTQPDMVRPFRIPGGNFGMWFVGVVGLLGVLVSGGLSFIPPKQISTGSPTTYVGLLVIGTVIFVAIPFIIFAFRKPYWKAGESDFEPFEWQAGTLAKSPLALLTDQSEPLADAPDHARPERRFP